MGESRNTFYRYQELTEEGDLDKLINKSRRTPNLENRIDPQIEEAVVDHAIVQPAHGQDRVCNKLR